MKESKVALSYNTTNTSNDYTNLGYKWTQPQQTYGPGGIPYGQMSDFFKNNPFQDVYGSLIGSLGGYAKDLFGRSAQNPLYTVGQGGEFSPEKFSSMFGFSTGVSPDDPNLPKWMSNLRGGQANIANEAVNQMANAGIASTRGGMGVNTGIDPRSQMSQQALQSIAQRYSDDYSKAVGWEQQNATLSNQMANALVSAYASMYGTDMNTAANILNTQLGATQGRSADLNNYLNLMNQAFQADTAWTNQQIKNRPQENAQIAAINAAKNQASQQAGQQQQLQNILSSLFGGQFGTTTGPGSQWLNYMQKYAQANSMGAGLPSAGSGMRGRMGTPATQGSLDYMRYPYLQPQGWYGVQ